VRGINLITLWVNVHKHGSWIVRISRYAKILSVCAGLIDTHTNTENFCSKGPYGYPEGIRRKRKAKNLRVCVCGRFQTWVVHLLHKMFTLPYVLFVSEITWQILTDHCTSIPQTEPPLHNKLTTWPQSPPAPDCALNRSTEVAIEVQSRPLLR
jgi:hypothetical protein